MLGHLDVPVRPRVTGPLPGPRSAELLARQERRDSTARVHPQHISIAVDEASGSFVHDLHGTVFIDLLTGTGVLSLGHRSRSSPGNCGISVMPFSALVALTTPTSGSRDSLDGKLHPDR